MDHEGLANLQACPVAQSYQFMYLLHPQSQGFFAKHMLSGFQTPARPVHMEVIGQGNIDCVNTGIGEKIFIAAVPFLHPGFPGSGSRALPLP